MTPPYSNTVGISFPKIFNASTLTVQEQARTQPQLGDTLRALFQPVTMVRITKEQQQSQIVEKPTPFIQRAVVQPFHGRKLQIMEQGERHWNWSTIQSTPDLLLATDDIIVVNGAPYRVMADKDFTQFGTVTYYVIRDYDYQPTLGT